jgi:hypothetical protein
VNDFLRDLDSTPNIAVAKDDLNEQLRASASRLGTAGDRFLDASRKDLQG